MEKYRVAEFEAPDEEVARLAEQAQLIAQQERAALQAVGAPSAGVAVEIGCGPAFFAQALRDAFPALRLFGLDIDAYTLSQARARLPVVRGDASAALPLAPGRFDLVYSRLFLRHLADPAASLRSMLALLKPGGLLAAIDSSDASLLLDPLPDDWAAIAAARAAWFTRRGCSADIGHRLPGLFVRAGVEGVRVQTVVVDSHTVGRAAFAQIALQPFLLAADPVLADPPRLQAATAAVARWSADPSAYGAINLYVVGGRRSS
jgi:SAM-dependent methyltransferase